MIREFRKHRGAEWLASSLKSSATGTAFLPMALLTKRHRVDLSRGTCECADFRDSSDGCRPHRRCSDGVARMIDDATGRKHRGMLLRNGDKPILHDAPGSPIWHVPSASSQRHYVVNAQHMTCECEDHPQAPSSVQAHLGRSAREGSDGAGVMPAPLPNPYKNPSYYDIVMQRNEEDAMRELLRCLAERVPKRVKPAALRRRPGQEGGRPRTDLGDLLVALGIASYFNKPSRKALVFKQAMLDGGYMKKGLSSATLRRFNDTEECSDMLGWALRSTALCAKEIERFYAVDSTHFKTPNSDLVVEFEAGKNEIQEKVRTAKMQIAFGVKTKMIFAMSVMDGTDSDQTALAPLLDQLNDGFLVDAILADSGYCSAENYDRVAAMGAKAYIDFKSTSRPGKSGHFNEQFELWKKGSPEWHSVYGLRALAETGNFHPQRNQPPPGSRASRAFAPENELLAAAVVAQLGAPADGAPGARHRHSVRGSARDGSHRSRGPGSSRASSFRQGHPVPEEAVDPRTGSISSARRLPRFSAIDPSSGSTGHRMAASASFGANPVGSRSTPGSSATSPASGIICSISMGMVAPRALKAWTFHFEGVGLDGRFVFARRRARSPLFVTVESAEGRMVTGFRRKGE